MSCLQVLDKDMVKAVAEEYGVEVLDLEEAGLEKMAQKSQDTDKDEDAELLLPRPPVVTVMGHVDHGKVRAQLASVRKGKASGIGSFISRVFWLHPNFHNIAVLGRQQSCSNALACNLEGCFRSLLFNKESRGKLPFLIIEAAS